MQLNKQSRHRRFGSLRLPLPKQCYYVPFLRPGRVNSPKLGCSPVRAAIDVRKLLLIHLGMAFRMAQDLGLEEDYPSASSPGSPGALPADSESRRRMSLTYSISDKLPPLFVRLCITLTPPLG